MSRITPCLMFDDRAEEAARMYVALFGGEIRAVSHYTEGMHKPAGAVLLVELDLAGHRFHVLNGGPGVAPNPSISFFAHIDSANDARRIAGVLADGGSFLMPLDAYPWSPCYAWVQDRFGVSWQIMTERRPASRARMVPCLMFSDAQHGRAEAAMQAYTGLFPDARVDAIERYVAGEGPTGTVKHGRFTLAGQDFVAMDSHLAHGIPFTDGVSLSVNCADQAEVDRLWAALTEGGGAPGQCGWLKDRFGVSWQIVPERIIALLTRDDAAATSRLFQALMPMGRLDIATLERAYRGTPD